MQDLVGYTAIGVSISTIFILFLQTRLVRKSLETTNYQDILERLHGVRDEIIRTESLSGVFEGHVEFCRLLQECEISVHEAFWIFNYLTVWENFYFQRRTGVMNDQIWKSYRQTMSNVMKTPKIKKFWKRGRELQSYSDGFVEFVNAILMAQTPKDPKPSVIHRFFR
jgi:hypothetical protein